MGVLEDLIIDRADLAGREKTRYGDSCLRINLGARFGQVRSVWFLIKGVGDCSGIVTLIAEELAASAGA